MWRRFFPNTGLGITAYGLMLTLILLAGAIAEAISRPPPVHFVSVAGGRRVWVQGLTVTVNAGASRDSRACDRGHADRQMVTFKDPPFNTKLDDVALIREHELFNWDERGVRNVHPHFHLYGPLVGDPTRYVFESAIFDNCPLWYRALPERLRRLFRERPSLSPPTPVSPGAPPQDDVRISGPK